MHGTPDGFRGPGRRVRNARGARRPEHHCQPPVPVRARIIWDDTGEQLWIQTVAVGWTGRLVYVDAAPLRRSDGYGFNYVWLDAGDVERC
jgi:hypothetical protein